MLVGDIMTRDPRTCAPRDPLSHAARIMWEQDCGCVPVVDGSGLLVGIITDRDVCMAALMRGRPITDITVESACAHVVFTVEPTDTLSTAETLMRLRRVHRLPVVDVNGHLVGILSLCDLARHLHPPDVRADALAPEAIAATLATLSQPRTAAGEIVGEAE